jgi:hypothetical protein
VSKKDRLQHPKNSLIHLITTLKKSSREIDFPLNNGLKINHLAGNKFPDYDANTPFLGRYQNGNSFVYPLPKESKGA